MTGAVAPFAARAVVIELDAVAIRIGEVDRDRAAVVRGMVDRVGVIDEPLNGVAEFAPVRIEERHVVKAGVAWRRCSHRGVPGV